MASMEAQHVQELFKRGVMLEQQRWITEKLGRSPGSVTSLDCDAEMIQEFSNGLWKYFRPGKLTYCFTFDDGAQATYGGDA